MLAIIALTISIISLGISSYNAYRDRGLLRAYARYCIDELNRTVIFDVVMVNNGKGTKVVERLKMVGRKGWASQSIKDIGAIDPNKVYTVEEAIRLSYVSMAHEVIPPGGVVVFKRVFSPLTGPPHALFYITNSDEMAYKLEVVDIEGRRYSVKRSREVIRKVLNTKL